MKKLTVIIPCYNSDRYLGQCLDDLTRQTFKDFEVIVVNDGSKPDSTIEIKKLVDDFSSRLTISYLEHEVNQGAAAARNSGLAQATGRYILFLDADDLLSGRYSIEYRCEFLDAHPEFDGIAGHSIRIDEDNRILPYDRPVSAEYELAAKQPEQVFKAYCQLAMGNLTETITCLFMFSGACMFQTATIKELGFNPSYEGEEDVELMLRFFESGKKIKVEKIPFFFYRKHTQQHHLSTKTALVTDLKQKFAQALSRLESVHG